MIIFKLLLVILTYCILYIIILYTCVKLMCVLLALDAGRATRIVWTV